MFPLNKTASSIIRARLIPVMLMCAATGLALVVTLVSILIYLSTKLVSLDIAILNSLTHWLMGGVFVVLGWFMLPVFIVLIAGIFQDITIYRIEKIDYPDTVRDTPPRFWPDFTHDIRFTVRALCLNIIIIPSYLIGIGPILSVLLNSYLLGQEFFVSAAGYHLGKPQARQLARDHRGVVYFGGFIITAITLTPLLNLFVPIIAQAWMVHVYHGIESPGKTQRGTHQ